MLHNFLPEKAYRILAAFKHTTTMAVNNSAATVAASLLTSMNNLRIPHIAAKPHHGRFVFAYEWQKLMHQTTCTQTHTCAHKCMPSSYMYSSLDTWDIHMVAGQRC